MTPARIGRTPGSGGGGGACSDMAEMLTAPLRFRDDGHLPRHPRVTVRCFAALPVPEDAAAALAQVVAPLRAGSWPVRWVRPEGIHITLKFYGEVAEDRAESIAE